MLFDEYAHLVFDPIGAPGFQLEGCTRPVEIVATAVPTARTVELQFSESPRQWCSGLSYRGHHMEVPGQLWTLNDVGLLTFYNQPLEPAVS